MTIETETLTISQNGTITTFTNGQRNAGDISILANELIDITESTISAQTQESTGSGGNVTLATKKLTVRDGSQIKVGTFGEGKAGSLTINASEFVKLFNTTAENTRANSLFAQTGGSGEGGELQINTSHLIVRDGSQIFAGTLANSQGSGGNLTVTASEFVEVSGTTADNEFPSSLSTSTRGFGSAGDLTISTKQFTVQDGAQVDAATLANGRAGTMTINATNSIKLTGIGGLFVQATNGGTAGNLNLETGELTIADGASVTVSSPEGLAGNLNINANSLFQNQGQITAETGVSEGDIGANINLEISDIWRLENESLVSATAFGIADGGNINIDTEFLVAFPNQNNDITADAFEGDGGNITINTNGIFGIEFRDQQTPLSDITASSEFGQQGEVEIKMRAGIPSPLKERDESERRGYVTKPICFW